MGNGIVRGSDGRNMMQKEFGLMVPNDNIYIKSDEMWFVGRKSNELYRGRLSTEECEYIASIPTGDEGSFRSTPYCVKYQDTVVCLPDRGAHIWLYNIEQKKFSKITVDKPQNMRLSITRYWIDDNTLLVCTGALYLIEIDLKYFRIKNYCQIVEISENDTMRFAREIIKNGNAIYFFDNKQKELCEFNILTKQTERYSIKEILNDIVTVCSDGEIFWLSDNDKCIYEWNKATKDIRVYTDFPQEFHVTRTGQPTVSWQKWVFYQSVCLDKYICLIPWNIPETMCNSILFMNKKTHKMNAVKIYDETESGDGQYVLEYVLEGRYIGIHYSHNCFISEIDTNNFEIRQKRMKFPLENYTKMIHQRISREKILVEKNNGDLPAFIKSFP